MSDSNRVFVYVRSGPWRIIGLVTLVLVLLVVVVTAFRPGSWAAITVQGVRDSVRSNVPEQPIDWVLSEAQRMIGLVSQNIESQTLETARQAAAAERAERDYETVAETLAREKRDIDELAGDLEDEEKTVFTYGARTMDRQQALLELERRLNRYEPRKREVESRRRAAEAERRKADASEERLMALVDRKREAEAKVRELEARQREAEARGEIEVDSRLIDDLESLLVDAGIRLDVAEQIHLRRDDDPLYLDAEPELSEESVLDRWRSLQQ